MNKVDYLRISLIDRCPFRCQYCMPEGAELDYIRWQELLTHEEILTLLKEVFIPIGFRKFRLTGGEPLVRPGIVDLVRDIASLPQVHDLAMTTNGFLLANKAQLLYEAGLKRINISLDSIVPDTFDRIIGNKGRSRWQQTWDGIQACQQVGFNPLKLNVVVILNPVYKQHLKIVRSQKSEVRSQRALRLMYRLDFKVYFGNRI